jgi:hypothetical protein
MVGWTGGELLKGYAVVRKLRVVGLVGDRMRVAVLRDPCSGLAIRKLVFEA